VGDGDRTGVVKFALDAFDAFERIRTPRDLVVDPEQGSAVFLVDSHDAGTEIHVLDLGTGGVVVHHDPGFTYAHLRSAGNGAVVGAKGLPDGELELFVRFTPDASANAVELAMPGAIEDIAALPDGCWLVRIADPGSERDGMHLGTIVASIAGPIVDPAERRWRRLFVVDTDRAEVTPVPTPGWTIWEAVGDADSILAVASQEPSPAGYYRPCLLRIRRDHGTVDVVHRTERQLARPRLTADGRALVIEGRSIVSGRVRHIDVASGASRLIGQDGDAPGGADLLEDVTDLVVGVSGRLWCAGWADRGSFVELRSSAGAQLARLEIDGTIMGRDAQPSVAPISDTEALIVVDRPSRPPEVARVDLVEGRVELLTEVNRVSADELDTWSPVDRRWSADDGMEIRGDLLLPSTVNGAPVPLVVLVHGGPTWLWGRQFAPAESIGLARVLAESGVAVLLPNPRGSSGRGLGFADAITGQIGERDVGDVLSGVDDLVTAGIADVNRIAVMGTSYGGYLSAWLAATTNRFRCAVALSAVADWCTFISTSAIGGGFDHVYFPAINDTTPAGREALASRSPAHWTGPIKTPLLILHGAADRITPVGQAHQLAHAWRRAGAAVDVAIYTDEGHEPVDPRSRRDAARRVVEFLHLHGIMQG
jgi:dipeptidyl aminopeptidase/acylaminoacyl peptidase